MTTTVGFAPSGRGGGGLAAPLPRVALDDGPIVPLPTSVAPSAPPLPASLLSSMPFSPRGAAAPAPSPPPPASSPPALPLTSAALRRHQIETGTLAFPFATPMDEDDDGMEDVTLGGEEGGASPRARSRADALDASDGSGGAEGDLGFASATSEDD